jgi:membrane protein implicated in regulation of membrane protease activity
VDEVSSNGQADVIAWVLELHWMRSQKEWLIEKAVVFLCLLIATAAVLWLLVGSVAYWVKHGWLPADTAGWVQALGALLAVAVAIAVPAWQKRHEGKLARLESRQRRIDCVNAVLSLTQDLIGHFEVAAHAVLRPAGLLRDHRPAAVESLARVTKSCIDLDLIAFGNEMVSFVLVIKSAALYAEQVAAQPNHVAVDYLEVAEQYQKRLRGLRAQEDTLIRYFDSLERL